MPRERLIQVDRLMMLRNIEGIAARQHADATDRSLYWDSERRNHALQQSAWIKRNVRAFAGRLLTPSHRKRHQTELRAMADEGLVELTPSHVRITDAGRATLEASHAG